MVMVRKHGSAAAERAEKRAAESAERSDFETWAKWVWIEKAVRELLRNRPERGERIN